MCEPFTDELKQRKFAKGAISISEAMYYYALLHSKVLAQDLSVVEK